MRRLVPTYKLTNCTESVAQLYAFAYLCTNRTHSASRQLSKWVFFFLRYCYSLNTPSIPLKGAHLGGLFFFRRVWSFTLIPSING